MEADIPDLPDSLRTFALMLASEHKQGLHEDDLHAMCKACHPVEAELFDRLDEQS